MIPTLPLRVRNRLADTILAALHDEGARRELEELVSACDGGAPEGWLGRDDAEYADLLCARARAAWKALVTRGRWASAASLDEMVDAAGALFDAGLYFEVHELLEPRWREARGEMRETLQGLIQVAVGYQHLANGNLAGARALLGEGADRLRGRALGEMKLDAFAGAVRECLSKDLDPASVPRFPRKE